VIRLYHTAFILPSSFEFAIRQLRVFAFVLQERGGLHILLLNINELQIRWDGDGYTQTENQLINETLEV
jgi:hypothetical protein